MIDIIETWIPQLMRYAHLINSGKLKEEWLSNDYTTSIRSYDELIEQIFDDLDSEFLITTLDDRQDVENSLKLRLRDFLSDLRTLDEFVEREKISDSAVKITGSDLWKDVEKSAARLVS